MKHFLCIALLMCLLTSDSHAQKYYSKTFTWEITQHAWNIIQIDTNYIVAGRFRNSTNTLIYSFVASVNINGEGWIRQDFSGTYFENGTEDLVALNENSLFLINEAKNLETGLGISYYVSLQPDLQSVSEYTNEAWQVNENIPRCATNISNKVLVGGWLNLPDTYGLYLYLTKLHPTTGEVLLDTIYNYYFNTPYKENWIQDIAAAPDGGAYLLATVNYAGDTGDIALIKIDSLDNWQWHQVYNPTPPTISWMSRDIAGHIITTSDGGVLMSYIADKPNIALRINYVHKLNAQHQTEWIIDAYCRGGGGPSLIQLADSSYFVGGSYYLDDGLYNKNAEILKLSSFGELLWRRQFGGNGDDYVYDAIVQDHDYSGRSGYVLCGRTESNLPPGRADAWLVRLNCMGLLTEPQAAFMAVPFPAMPQTIAFANQSQYVYPDSIDGGHYILDWGDGSPAFTCGQGYDACSGSLPTHTYQVPGLYPITLQAIVCNDTSTLTRAACIGFTPNPQAAFTYQDFGGIIQFTNLSQNSYLAQGGYFSWDFGDGSPPSSAEHPTHEYTENGSYTVSLTLVVCQDTSIYTQEIAVQTVGLPPNPITPLPPKAGNTILVYPNPAQNTLTFEWVSKSPSGDLGVRLVSLTGQTVLQTQIPAGEASKTISVAHLPMGLYIYVVSSSVVSGDTDYGDNGGMVLVRGKVAVVR